MLTYVTCGLSWLTSFPEHVFKVHSCCHMSKVHHFFLWLNSICIHHILCIHSSVDGHSNYFGYYEQCYYDDQCTSFCVDIDFQLLRNIPRSRIPRSYGYSMFNSLRNVLVFSKVAEPLPILTRSVWGFQLLHNFSNTLLSHFLFLVIWVLSAISLWFWVTLFQLLTMLSIFSRASCLFVYLL